jgi:hypothetical protein
VDVPKPESLDDENGNCRLCGHAFNPHIIIAYDVKDFSKGGEMRCQEPNCNCFRAISFNLQKEVEKKAPE